MNFPTLFKITPEPFALDLSDRSIKIIKLSRKRGALFLENFGEFEIKGGIMEEGVIIEESKLVHTILGALSNLKKGPLHTPYVACSIPEPITYLRVIQLPKMEEEEIDGAIRWEVEANIPVPLSEIYFDWRIIPGNIKKVDHFDILVSAAPKNIINSYVELLQKAGLKPLSFEPESIADSRALIKRGFVRQPVLIVDLGRTRTSFVIYAGHSLQFSSSSKISGLIITSNVMRGMNIDEDEAVRLKEEVGIDEKENKELYETVIPALTDLKEQIQQYIDFYIARTAGHAHESVVQISKIILMGGGAKIKGLEKYLALALGIPVEIANPWVNILEAPLKETPELSFSESVRYTTALGLALNNFMQ